MTVNEDVPKLTKEIQIGSPAVLRDRSKPYTAEKNIIIESLSISALTVRVNHLAKDNSNNFIFGADTSIVMTDGQTISPDSVSSYSTKVPAQNDAACRAFQEIDSVVRVAQQLLDRCHKAAWGR